MKKETNNKTETALCALPLRRKVVSAMILGTVCLAGAPVLADTFPSKTVTIVVPFPPGGGTDTLARVLAPRLSAQWKQSVVVENKPGASGAIGSNYVANSTPDGHTLVMASTAAITEKNITRFAPVALVSAEAYAVTLHPSVPAKNVRELIDYAKANPGKLQYGSSGIGAASHLSAELFKSKAGVKMEHIPYKGTGQAVTDLMAGHIHLMFSPIQTVKGHLQSGKLKAIAVTGTKPVEALPGVPTVAASGLPGYDAVGWFGLLAPANTPKETVARINADVNRLMSTPEISAEMRSKGADPDTMTVDQFGSFIRREQTKWSTLIREAGISME
jgi:tripartite-type tricarboxylate transporter receptor subunit TctC